MLISSKFNPFTLNTKVYCYVICKRSFLFYIYHFIWVVLFQYILYGFVGNTILKMYEGTASTVLKIIVEEMLSSGAKAKIGAFLLKPVFKSIKKKFDYKEYGGAPFLGVDGICIKAHGSSDGKAIKNAIRQSKEFHDNKVLDKIKEQLELKSE